MVDPYSMSKWYPVLKDHAVPSTRIELPRELVEEAVKQGFPTHGDCNAVAELLKQYSEVYDALEKALQEHGMVFVRGEHRALGQDVVFNLASSRCRGVSYSSIHAYPQDYVIASAYTPEGALLLYLVNPELKSSNVMWVRKHVFIAEEARVFIVKGEPRLVSWMRGREASSGERPVFIQKIAEVLTMTHDASSRLGLSNFTVDIAVAYPKNEVYIVDVNPPSKPNEALYFGRDYQEQVEKALQKSLLIVRHPIKNPVVVHEEYVVSYT